MDLVIPGWAVVLSGALGGGLVGWLVWLTVAVFGNKEAIAINTANDLNVTKEFNSINSKMDEMKKDFRVGFDKLEHKLDLYIKNENDFLKDLLKNRQ